MKKIIGWPVIINGRKLSLSKAIRAGDFVFLTGQIPFKNGAVYTSGSIEEQTTAVIEDIKKTLSEANCKLSDVIKAMVWLKNKSDFLHEKVSLSEWDPKKSFNFTFLNRDFKRTMRKFNNLT